MGTWGDGPFANDSAADLQSAVDEEVEGAFADNPPDVQAATFDRLEGAFTTFRDALSEKSPEAAILMPSHFQRARAAVVMLSALLEQGVAWRPAEDGAPAANWQAVILAFVEARGANAPAIVTKTIRRELARFVELAGTSEPRRPLPDAGTVERRLRDRRASRDLCGWARPFGDDLGAAWQACPAAGWITELALALDAAPERLLRLGCGLLSSILNGTVEREGEAYALVHALFATGAQDGIAGIARHAGDEPRLRDLAQALRPPPGLSFDERLRHTPPPLARFLPTSLRLLGGAMRHEPLGQLVVHLLAGAPVFWRPHEENLRALRSMFERELPIAAWPS